MNSKNLIFSGCATAIVTPFKKGEVDFYALEELIKRQLSSGVSALVVLGTTGESPTVSDGEREEIIRLSKQVIASRVPLIVGTGSNCTERCVKLTQGALKLGADACLCVTPYYNKATDKGLYLHYRAVARSVDIPIILYNVPSRTGVKLSQGALDMISELDNVVAIKEASGDVSEIEGKIARFGDRFTFYSGCDELILPIYSLGGHGVISAVANVVPDKISELCALFESGETEKATALALSLSSLIKEMFAEVNPIPIKCALSLLGLCENELRLPLAPSDREGKILDVLSAYSLQ